MEDTLASCLDLMRRLPPQNTEQNLDLLVSILPHLADDLLSSVDQPLRLQTDSSGKKYLICDYNRDGDCYRSPWTNVYDPDLSDGTLPSAKLRKLEMAMNDAFDIYRDMYYEGGVSSVYLWDLDDGFAGVVLMKKNNVGEVASASWDSVHVFEISERGRTAHCKLTSTVMLYMIDKGTGKSGESGGEVCLGGSMTRQNEVDVPLDTTSEANETSSHIANIGRLVEDIEMKMRNLLQEVYFSKTKDIVTTLRSSTGYGEAKKRSALQGELVGLLKGQTRAMA